MHYIWAARFVRLRCFMKPKQKRQTRERLFHLRRERNEEKKTGWLPVCYSLLVRHQSISCDAHPSNEKSPSTKKKTKKKNEKDLEQVRSFPSCKLCNWRFFQHFQLRYPMRLRYNIQQDFSISQSMLSASREPWSVLLRLDLHPIRTLIRPNDEWRAT